MLYVYLLYSEVRITEP